jgi:hypothetical protein
MPGAIALLTRESLAEILVAGATGAWVTAANRVQQYPYVVLIRSGRHPSSPSDIEHGTAFLVGRISGARETAKSAVNGYPRIFIQIEEYALITVPNAWSKSQNPVWYTDLATLGIDERQLQFQPMPHDTVAPVEPAERDHVLANMKREIGLLFNVPVSAVEITIRL